MISLFDNERERHVSHWKFLPALFQGEEAEGRKKYVKGHLTAKEGNRSEDGRAHHESVRRE